MPVKNLIVPLGRCYTNGWGVERDLEEAARWYRAAAEQGNCWAQQSLAKCYENGDGVDQNHEEAANWYRRLVEDDGTYKDEDVVREAALELALYLSMGLGVAQNFDEARTWFFRCRAEDTRLYDCLEMMFDVAEFQDVMDWVQAGVDRGDPEFVHALGWCYSSGMGVEADNKLALKLTLDAAKSGYEPARDFLFDIMLFTELHPALDEPEEFDELEKYLSSRAERGDAESAFALGNFYMADWHGKENPELAFKSFKTAAEQPDGVPSWTYQLGYCYYEGYGVKENPEEAFKWFLQSAKRGFVLAMEVVSECYREGSGVEKNLEEAETWLTRYEEKTASPKDKERDDEPDDD